MKKRQTMGKMMRDRELRERRALKQQKKDERKLAAAEGGLAPEAEDGEEGGTEDGAAGEASADGPQGLDTGGVEATATE